MSPPFAKTTVVVPGSITPLWNVYLAAVDFSLWEKMDRLVDVATGSILALAVPGAENMTRLFITCGEDAGAGGGSGG